jgi:hypothetical protein
MARNVVDGWATLPRLASGLLGVPVVVGFVALGAAVLVGRSLRDVVREAWNHLPSRPRRSEGRRPEQSNAA